MDGPAPCLEAKVAFLRQSASYTEPAYRVEAIETHMSWVFLAGRHAYKLKKPVWNEFLDFRPLAARRHYCAEELRLNRRLAPAVYLGLVALTVDRQGHFALGGAGVPVDWLVKMVRLPARLMLDYALAHRALREADLARVAERLAAFYRTLPAEPLDGDGYRARFRRLVADNLAELGGGRYRLAQAQVQAVCDAQLAALGRMAALLGERAAQGRIVEGHGDLRPEHIFLGEPVAVIDCLEFSRDLRLADPADELGFLALECERLGAPAAGAVLAGRYHALTGDTPAPGLVHFYQSCRATTRAAIAARHLLDEKLRHSPHWLERANTYLRLAGEHIEQCR